VVLQQSRGINWWAAAAGQTQVAQGRFWSFLGHCCSADLFPLFRRKLHFGGWWVLPVVFVPRVVDIQHICNMSGRTHVLAVFGVGCCLTSQTGRQDRRLD